jgi:hypothetical protein
VVQFILVTRMCACTHDKTNEFRASLVLRILTRLRASLVDGVNLEVYIFIYTSI